MTTKDNIEQINKKKEALEKETEEDLRNKVIGEGLRHTKYLKKKIGIKHITDKTNLSN